MKQGVNVVITDNAGKVLILKRSLSEKYCPNFWDLPGGKVEEGETLLEAAEREAKEESGLELELEHDYFYVFHCPNVELDIYAFRASIVGGEVALSDEHTDFKWVSKSECNNFEYVPSAEATLKQFFKA
jgi:8-oxo-dGTP diphosphatase